MLHEKSAGPRRLVMNRSCLATETEQREAETDSEGDNDDLGATALFCHGFPFDKQVPAFYHLRLFPNEEFRERVPALWACSSGGEGVVCVESALCTHLACSMVAAANEAVQALACSALASEPLKETNS